MTKVLIVATSRKTRGGITSVIKAHEQGKQWKEYHCRWIGTHVDKSQIVKLLMWCVAILKYCWYLPGVDIVHFHLSERTTAKRKRILMPLAILLKKKIIVHFHAFSPDSTINSKNSGLYKYLFTHADVVVVLSNYWKKVVNDKFQLGDKVRVIYNPCTISTLPAQYKKTKSILYAGTLNQRKGYADLIKAFAKVAGKYPDWKVVLAGNGETEQAHNLATSLGVEKQVVLLGWVSGNAKDKAYKQASVFCLPSYAEGFPMAVLDAWAYGLPVITTPVGGIPDIAMDGKNLLLFNPGDVDALAERLDKVMGDADLREHLSRESEWLAANTFNLDNINRQIGELYNSILVESAKLTHC
jgi:glycosyltransferase involved in cell wall biosynthesis